MASSVRGIVGTITHGASAAGRLRPAATSLAKLGDVVPVLTARVARSEAGSITAIAAWRRGVAMEQAGEGWLLSHGINARRNVSLDLRLRSGVLVRPDFFTPGALDGALLIGEAKHRNFMPLTKQLRQYVAIARANHVPLHLFMPEGSSVSRPLQKLIDKGSVRLLLL